MVTIEKEQEFSCDRFLSCLAWARFFFQMFPFLWRWQEFEAANQPGEKGAPSKEPVNKDPRPSADNILGWKALVVNLLLLACTDLWVAFPTYCCQQPLFLTHTSLESLKFNINLPTSQGCTNWRPNRRSKDPTAALGVLSCSFLALSNWTGETTVIIAKFWRGDLYGHLLSFWLMLSF